MNSINQKMMTKMNYKYLLFSLLLLLVALLLNFTVRAQQVDNQYSYSLDGVVTDCAANQTVKIYMYHTL